MNCDVCGEPDPIIHLCEIRNGVKTERHLCTASTANETGMSQDSTKVSITELLKQFVARHAQSKPDKSESE
jgi:protein-arginine kinase activator protein McsA